MCVYNKRPWSCAERCEDASQQQREKRAEPLSNRGAPGPQQQFIQRDGPQVEGLLQRDAHIPAPRPSTASFVPSGPGREKVLKN